MMVMAMSIKNPEVESLAGEIAELTGETKTEAIRRSLRERRDRLAYRVTAKDRRRALVEILEREVWSRIPAHELGRRLTRKEEAAILGLGVHGV
jgi:antitoxin VapB